MGDMWVVLVLMGVAISMILAGVNETFQNQTEIQTQKTIQLTRGNQPYANLILEVADTPETLEKGLMFRTHLPPNTGMLFQFFSEAPRSFWMRNTLISLDMLFLKEDGRIITIHQNTQTQSDQNYPSTEPAKYGIELPAGTVKNLGIRLGDRAFGL